MELFFAFRLSINVGSTAFRFRTVMLLVEVIPTGRFAPDAPLDDEAFDMLGINWAGPDVVEGFNAGDIVGKLRFAVALGSPLCAFTTMLGPGSTFRTVAAPGIVFVITKSCFRPRLAPSAEGFMAIVELLLALAGEDVFINDGLFIAIR